MKKCSLLFGFDSPEFSNGVINCLKSLGCEVNYEIRLSKTSIRDFLKANTDFDTVILLEVVNRPGSNRPEKYSADELAWLTDDRDINVIVVLSATYKGTDYMKVLYQAGITSALYQKGRRGGATVQEIAKLCMKKRSRKDALEYYDIDRKPLQFASLGKDDFEKKMQELMSEQYGESLIERFIYICNTLSQKQTASFIQKLPPEILNELKLYEEFYIIVNFLKKVGLDLKIKRPKNVSIGLVKPDRAVMLEVAGAAPKLQTSKNTVRSEDDCMLEELYASAEQTDLVKNVEDFVPVVDEPGDVSEPKVVDVGNMFFDVEYNQDVPREPVEQLAPTTMATKPLTGEAGAERNYHLSPAEETVGEGSVNREVDVEEVNEIREEKVVKEVKDREKPEIIDLSSFFGGPTECDSSKPIVTSTEETSGAFELEHENKGTSSLVGEKGVASRQQDYHRFAESQMPRAAKPTPEPSTSVPKSVPTSEPDAVPDADSAAHGQTPYIRQGLSSGLSSMELEMVSAFVEKKIREGIEQGMAASGMNPCAVQGSPQRPVGAQMTSAAPIRQERPAKAIGKSLGQVAPIVCSVVIVVCFVAIIYMNLFL